MKQLRKPIAPLIGGLCVAILAGCAGSPRPSSMPSEPTDSPLTGLTWLVGSWVRASEESLSEEHWMPPRGSVMLGTSLEVERGRMVFFEYLRIEAQPDGVYYFASPQGRQPPTAFKMIECEPHRVVFENPAHDFPQRIAYWLDEGGSLHARIEGRENGQTRSSEWEWQRAPITSLER